MRVIVATLVGCAAATAPDYAGLWKQFKTNYSKTYDSNGDDEKSRFDIFKVNMDKIQEHNAKGLSFKFAVNQFADLTEDEFKATYVGGYRPELRVKSTVPFPAYDPEALDDEVDWVKKGGVTPVKNQGRCGSCWAFSTTGSVEGAFFVGTGKLLSLSEENLVECDHDGEMGCNGGIMDKAFDWIKTHGLCAEDDYPYTAGGGKAGTCKAGCQPAVVVGAFVDVPSQNEDALKAAVSKQPVSIAIEADKTVFQMYGGGVLDNAKCGTNLDHGVLIVGYGMDGDTPYWTVKNSWGESWGEKGYIRIARGKNMCGVSLQPSYPTGGAPAPPGPAPGPPGPAPPAPGGSHYENPTDGCQDDEEAIQVQGLPGAFCSPLCSGGGCPSDVPTGVTADPQCVLNDPVHHQKRCALTCSKSSECGEAKCHHPSGAPFGICTYAASIAATEKVEMSVEEQVELVV